MTMQPTSCACDVCRGMCSRSVCLPTPAEARALVRIYPKRMGVYVFADGAGYIAPATKGHEGKTLRDTVGECTFFDGQNCELHAAGRKPLEGRLAHHDKPWQPARLAAISAWKGKQFESVLATLEKVTA